jgi:hypothetical protein
MLGALIAFHLLTAASPDPFGFFSPTVVTTASERQRVAAGEPIARAIPSRAMEVAIFAAVAVNVDGDRLVAWMLRIEELKKSRYVLAIHRFSNPPRLEDLATLELDDVDLSAIQACRPGRCRLKLSAAEMSDLQKAASEARGDWKAALQNRFRQLVLARVTAFLANGSVAPYNDHARQVRSSDEFARLVDHSAFLFAHAPQIGQFLRSGSVRRPSGVESFVYWSKEQLGNRPVISVTDVNIFRSQTPGLPDVLVAGREIYSTHYVDASFSLTALMQGESGKPNYLMYTNRSSVDVLGGGVLGGVFRWALQRRLKSEAGNVLQNLRKRLESGLPPGAPGVVRLQPRQP